MIEVRVHRSIAEVPAAAWDALDGAAEVPFLGWTWLDALERTGCVGEEAGWIPHHFTFWETDAGAEAAQDTPRSAEAGRRMIGAAPCYVKDNSEGEFVFDWSWASAAPRFRVRYYPKLLVAVPFTPATSHRVLAADPTQRPRLLAALAETLRRVTEALEISSAHVLFPTPSEAEALEAAGLAHRHGVQFQWHNQGYATFDDFLGSFNAKRRAQLKRERREVAQRGVTVETLSGADLRPEIVDHAFRFYLATVDKFTWGRRYLNRAFFEEIAAKVPGVEVVLARNGSQQPIAGAVNLAGKEVLFGRYWGATEELPFLHFEVCYYHSIDDAIARKLVRFEPGAGGSHKVARGFAPTVTHSLHHIENARFDRAIRNFLDEERLAVDAAVAQGEAHFRH